VICPPLWEKLPPLGPAYISEYLKLKGYSSHIYDLNIVINKAIDNEYKKDWTINTEYLSDKFFKFCFGNFKECFDGLIKTIKDNNIEVVGFSVFKSNRSFSINTAKYIKEKFPEVKIIFGGPEVFTMDLEGYDTLDFVDNFVVGEGEQAVLDILSGNKTERVIKFSQLSNIDFFPKFKNYNLKNYARPGALPILFSRGCVNSCSFCSERLLFKGYRTRDPEVVIEEMKYHIEVNKIKWFTFYDSMINGNLHKLEKLVQLIIENKLDIFWDAQLGIRDGMDIELLKKMKASGCINLFVGLESASDHILKLMKKNFTAPEAVGFFNKLKKAGLNYEVSLIVDFPGEEEQEFIQTQEFLIEHKDIIPKVAQINSFKNYPGISIQSDGNRSNESKIERILKMLDEKKIKYTKQYINNLV
jgi:radical SAM superfamily enzyme YgiQ (UPF0313 family)